MIRLRLLGETAIDVAGVPVGPESQVIFAVLLLLSLERGKRMARTALHRLLWPAADDESGRHNLRQVAYKLRQLGVPLDATQSSLMLPSSAVEGELVELLSGSGAVGARLLAGRRVGELLPGYAPTFSSPFADWVDEQRGLLQSGLRRALLSAMAEARQSGRWREVEAIAREVLRFDPLNEEATLALAEATALAGSKAQAIDIIDRYLGEMGRHPGDLRLPANVLRRRIAERFPAHRYVSAADRCFVGREAEMAELLTVWHAARDRRGSALLLWGEPGIGKTRLAQELGKVAVLQGAQVQRVASRSWDVGRPLGAIVDLVPPLRELPGAAGIDPRCHDYLDRLTRHDPSRTLTDLPDPATLHRQVRQAVFDLIDALLAEAPLVLLLEDVQWLDAASWEVVAELLRMARTRRLMVVLTSRVPQPPQMPESEDWQALRRVRVAGIDATATNELLDTMTREAGRYMDPEHREWSVPLAGGNPLYVQEVALQWLEKGSTREAPGSIRAMIEARIDALSPIAYRVLQIVSLLSSEVPLRVISSALGESVLDVLTSIEALEASSLLALREGSCNVRHAVIADIALARLPQALAILLHERIAGAIGDLDHTDRTTTLIWEKYRHYSLAGIPERATDSLLQYIEHLAATGRAEECIAMLVAEAATSTSDACQMRIANRLAQLLVHFGKWEQIIAIAETGPASLTRSSALALALLEARWRLSADIVQLVEESRSVALRQTFSPDVRVRAAIWAMVFAGNAGRTFPLHEVDMAVTPLLNLPETSRAAALHYEVIRLARAGDFPRLLVAARQLSEVAASTGAVNERIRLMRHAAFALEIAGHPDEALTQIMAALALCEQSDVLAARSQCQQCIAAIQLYRGDAIDALSWAALAAKSAVESRESWDSTAAAFLRIQGAAILGDREEVAAGIAHIGGPILHDSNSTRQASSLSAHLRAACVLDYASERIESLLRHAIPTARYTANNHGSDFTIAAILHAQLRLNRRSEGLAILAEYLPIRPRSGPLHMDLAAAMKELGT